MVELMDTLTLFGDPTPPPPERPTIEGAAWSRVHSKAKCAQCMRELVETKGAAPVAKAGRFRRRTSTTDELLCHEHAQRQRLADGMPAFRSPRGA